MSRLVRRFAKKKRLLRSFKMKRLIRRALKKEYLVQRIYELDFNETCFMKPGLYKKPVDDKIKGRLRKDSKATWRRWVNVAGRRAGVANF